MCLDTTLPYLKRVNRLSPRNPQDNWHDPMKKILSLTAAALLALSTSQTNAGLSVFTNVTSIRDADITPKPVNTIRDADVASESASMEEATYHLLLDLGFTEEEAVMLLFFDSVTELGKFHLSVEQDRPESVYAEREFE